jgi:hypothetical protein
MNCRLQGIKQVRAGRCFRSTAAHTLFPVLITSVNPDRLHNHYQRRAVMNSRPFLILAILATTAAFGAPADALSAPLDAQAQAAALLSRPQTSGSSNAHEPAPTYSSALVVVDANARAAALLSGVRIGPDAKGVANVTRSAVALDAHARAAALLSGSRITAENSRISETSKTVGQHPAVLVAQKWSTRGIDPNTFIVAHPARLQLLAASETDEDRVTRVDARGAENAGSSTSAGQ